MSGPIAAHNTRMSFIIPRVLRGWLGQEADKRGETASDVLREAVTIYRVMPPAVRQGFLRTAQEGVAGEGPTGRDSPVAIATGPPPS